jgi:hypothetical protein
MESCDTETGNRAILTECRREDLYAGCKPKPAIASRMMCAFTGKHDMRKTSRKAAAPKKKSAKRAAAVKSSDADRKRRVAEIAYSLGARRGFDGDTDAAREDWLEAERIFDAEATK